MRTVILFFLVMCLTLGSSQLAQCQEPKWNVCGNVPDAGDRWDGLSFVNQDTGWIVGTVSGMQRTYDGGKTWTDLEGVWVNSTLPFLRTVAFASSKVGWVGSLGGPRLMKTTDAGDTWVVQTLDTTYKGVCGLQTFSTDRAYAVGPWSAWIYGTSHFTTTTDGGQTYKSQTMLPLATTLADLAFQSEDVGLVGGSVAGGPSDGLAVILRTTDAGASWTPVYTDTIVGTQIWKFYQLSTSIIYAAVQSLGAAPAMFLKSKDGGKTWTQHLVRDANGDQPPATVQAVAFVNELKGWVGGRGFNLYETTDGGDTWKELGDSVRAVNKFQFFSDTLGYAAGQYAWRYGPPPLTSVINTPFTQPTVVLAHFDVMRGVVITIHNHTPIQSAHLYQLDGALVSQRTYSGVMDDELTLPSSNLAQGSYLVVVMTNTDMHIAKLRVVR